MSSPIASLHGAETNPFSTRFYEPGKLPFLFGKSSIHSISLIFETFVAQHYCGQIVGPCGTGKSTLLGEMVACARRHGFHTQRITLRAQDRHLPRNWHALPAHGPDATSLSTITNPAGAGPRPGRLVFLDGAEQLSWWTFTTLRATCRRRGWGLLITSHRSRLRPTLWTSSVNDEVAQAICSNILSQCHQAPALVTEADVPPALRKANGNMRLALFELYDLYELRASRQKGAK